MKKKKKYGWSILNELLQRGNCNVNALGTYKDGNFFEATPLYVACALGCDLSIIELLLDNNADPNIPDQDGYTPLMATTRYSKQNRQQRTRAINIANYLLWRGAYINAVDKLDENTVLHLAIDSGDNLYTRFLIQHGADPFNIKNRYNLNALTLFAKTVAGKKIDDGYRLKVNHLKGFINELRQSKHFDEKHIQTVYKLFGVAYYPFNLEYIKSFWKNLITLEKGQQQQQPPPYKDKIFLTSLVAIYTNFKLWRIYG